MSAKRRPARWRRCRTVFGPEVHELCRGDERLATVQKRKDGDEYFWYGRIGDRVRNTASEQPLSLDKAKADAAAWIREVESTP